MCCFIVIIGNQAQTGIIKPSLNLITKPWGNIPSVLDAFHSHQNYKLSYSQCWNVFLQEFSIFVLLLFRSGHCSALYFIFPASRLSSPCRTYFGILFRTLLGQLRVFRCSRERLGFTSWKEKSCQIRRSWVDIYSLKVEGGSTCERYGGGDICAIKETVGSEFLSISIQKLAVLQLK